MSATDKFNILMVDDQPGKLLTYKEILGELGENLIAATSAKEALSILLKTDVAVVLLDVNMPEIDGFELAQMIRQHPRFKKTAIIFVSAVNLTDLDRLKGYSLGAVDYISVPVVPQLLRAKVRVFVEMQRQAMHTEHLNEQLRQMSSRLMLLQDAERRRVARELHDGLGQDLAALQMAFDRIADESSVQVKDQLAAEGRSVVIHAIQQVRTISYLLHPPVLDELGLASALRWYLDGVTKRSGINTVLDVQPRNFPRLSQDLETALFRVVQEALTNVFRHSAASQCWVVLSHEGGRVVVMIRDNGKGLSQETAELRPDKIGVGLGGMKQRTSEFGGQFRVSNVSPGTLVEVVVPLPPRDRERRIPPQLLELPSQMLEKDHHQSSGESGLGTSDKRATGAAMEPTPVT